MTLVPFGADDPNGTRPFQAWSKGAVIHLVLQQAKEVTALQSQVTALREQLATLKALPWWRRAFKWSAHF